MIYTISESCHIIGYGATRHAGPSQKQLFEADVRVIGNQHCRDIIGHIWAPKSGANTFCALGHNQDSCQGDSGGPLICQYGSEGRQYIYGLVSHGLTCGIKGMPSIYTVTRPYYDWVQLLLQQNWPWCDAMYVHKCILIGIQYRKFICIKIIWFLNINFSLYFIYISKYNIFIVAFLRLLVLFWVLSFHNVRFVYETLQA